MIYDLGIVCWTGLLELFDRCFMYKAVYSVNLV